MSPGNHEHGRIAINISTPLDHHSRKNKLGRVYAAETGFKIGSNPDTVRAPDVASLSQERLERVGAVKGYWPGAPDLVVEIISPGDSHAEVEQKVFDWLEAGAKMVVVVNSRKRVVTAYRSLTDIVVLTESDMLDGGDVVTGWRMAVKDIFE